MVLVRMDVDALTGVVGALRSFFDEAMDEWTNVSNAASKALTRCERMSSGLTTHLPAVAQLAADLQARVDLAVLVNTDADGRTPTGWVEYTVPGTQEPLADVRGALGQALATYAASDHVGDGPEAMTAFNERLARYLDDDVVMCDFYQALTAEGLLDLMTHSADTFASNDISLELRTDLLANLKSGLTAATGAWSDGDATTYAAALVDAATGQAGLSDNEYAPQFHRALSYLLYDSNFSDAFLTTAADKIDAFERIARDGEPGFWSGLDAGQSSWPLYFPQDAMGASYDPAVSLMSALGNNPQVSLDFFMGDDGIARGTVSNRQMYWLHDRDWMDDKFSCLSEALLAATTDPSLLQPPDSATAAQAALLASHTVNLIGHRHLNTGQMTEGDGKETAASNFATILSTYMHGVDNMISTNSYDWDNGDTARFSLTFYPAEQPNTPVFNADSLDAFITLSSSTEDGMRTLRDGLNTYTNVKYGLTINRLLAEPDNEDAKDKFDLAYVGQAKMEGFFVRAVGLSAIAEARGQDTTTAAWMALGSDVVGAIPFGTYVSRAGGDLLDQAIVNFTAGQGRKGAVDSLSETFASLEGEEVDKQNYLADASFDRASYRILETLYQYPSLTATAIPKGAEWAPDGRVPTYDEYVNLSSGTQSTGLSYMQSSDLGVGKYFKKDNFETAYRNAFNEYFEKGDG